MRELMLFFRFGGQAIRNARAAVVSKPVRVLFVLLVIFPAVLLTAAAVGADWIAIPVIALGILLLAARWPVLVGLIAAGLAWLSGYTTAAIAIAAVVVALVPLIRIFRDGSEDGDQ